MGRLDELASSHISSGGDRRGVYFYGISCCDIKIILNIVQIIQAAWLKYPWWHCKCTSFQTYNWRRHTKLWTPTDIVIQYNWLIFHREYCILSVFATGFISSGVSRRCESWSFISLCMYENKRQSWNYMNTNLTATTLTSTQKFHHYLHCARICGLSMPLLLETNKQRI